MPLASHRGLFPGGAVFTLRFKQREGEHNKISGGVFILKTKRV